MELTKSEFISELNAIFKLNCMGAYLNAEISEKFYMLTVRMLEENEKYNLTAIKEPIKIIHYNSSTRSGACQHNSKYCKTFRAFFVYC